MSEFSSWWNESIGNPLTDFNRELGTVDFLKSGLKSMSGFLSSISKIPSLLTDPSILTYVLIGGVVLVAGGTLYYYINKK
jgi:hypothetical protein